MARSEWRGFWNLLNGPQNFEESQEAFDANVALEPVLGGAGVFPGRGFEEASSRGEADKTSTLIVGIGFGFDIPPVFQVAKEVVNRLFGDLHAIGNLRRALSLKAFVPEKGDMRAVEIVEAVTAYTLIDVFPDALPREAKKRAD